MIFHDDRNLVGSVLTKPRNRVFLVHMVAVDHIPPDLVVQPFVFHNSLEISIGTPMVCPELVQTI
jgi:hypothetical protein